jgi:methylenetetrahydrofolate dehydrogenase (NADP+)/methenyltetrahydrofolate cyclohydrolase
MAEILKGAPVAAVINEATKAAVRKLAKKGIEPCLAILRVGEKPDDIYYENSAVKRSADVGVKAVRVTLPGDVTEEELLDRIRELNEDDAIHGVLILMPLPRTIDANRVRQALRPDKDVDGITPGSMEGIYSGSGRGYAPCTAQSCIEILDHYDTEVSGKNVVVVGRSLVIGKPVSMLLLNKNATVTICHSKTENLPDVVKKADIVVAAVGRAMMIDGDYLSEGQTVIDVGMNVGADGKMCGDVDFGEAESIVKAITPPSGGVGAVTTAVLLNHVVQAADK